MLDHYEGWICKIRGHYQPFECTRIKEGMAPGDHLVFEKTGKVVCDTCGLLLK